MRVRSDESGRYRDKVGAEDERQASVVLALDNRDQHSRAVLFGEAHPRQEFLGTLVGSIVKNDGVEAPGFEQL